MSSNKPDLGKLTNEETEEVAAEALSLLNLADRVKVVLDAFDTEDREELMAKLEEGMEAKD
jgi:23S rRNA G2445 N2-methylase RlmL